MATGNDSVLVLDRAENSQELEFLLLYREADDAGKRRITRMLHAAERGDLPSVEQANKMTAAEKRAYIDALPEYEPLAVIA